MCVTALILLYGVGFHSCTEQENGVEIEIENLHRLAFKAKSDSTYVLLKAAQRIIEDNHSVSDSFRAENEYLMGMYLFDGGKPDSSFVHFHAAIDYIKDSITNNRHLDYFFTAYDNYMSLDRFGDCISISQKFQALIPKNNFSLQALAHYFNEDVYRSSGEYEKSLRHNLQRIDMLIKANDTLGLPPALISQAKLKYNYLEDKQGAYAILDSLVVNKETLTNDFNRQLFGTYGAFLFWDEKFKDSRDYYLQGINYTKKTPKTYDKSTLLATGYCNLAEVNIELGNYKEAKLFLDSVARLNLNKIENRIQLSYRKYRYKLATLTSKDPEHVLNYLDSLHAFQENRYAQKYNDELNELKRKEVIEKKLYAEKRQSDLDYLRIRITLLILSGLVLIAALLVFLFFRKRKLDHERQQLQLHQRLLRSQMNPHFTFNTIYAIKNLIKKNPLNAQSYLLKFTRLLRLILENSTADYVQLNKEVESLTKYLELQLLRFPKLFTYDISLINIEEDDLVFVPPMMLQPLVENCIEHGFSNISYLGYINVRLKLEKDFIHCEIEDNGVGIKRDIQDVKYSSSTKLISDFLTKVTKSKFEIIDKSILNAKKSGTLISFYIPFKYSEND